MQGSNDEFLYDNERCQRLISAIVDAMKGVEGANEVEMVHALRCIHAALTGAMLGG